MKELEEMSYSELKEEIKYIVSLFDDDSQAQHSAAYLEELMREYTKKVTAQLFQ